MTKEVGIAGFHCHTIIKTIQQIKSRIKEIQEDEYSNSLAKIQVCAMFRAEDIRRNVLLKFKRLCMETPVIGTVNAVSIKDGLRTTDYGLRTGYKTWTEV